MQLIIKDYDEDKIKTLMQNKAIVRNKRKIEAAKINANVFIQIQKEFGSFDAIYGILQIIKWYMIMMNQYRQVRLCLMKSVMI